MRSTIHLVSARDYWPLALAVERPRRAWWLKVNRDGLGARDMSAAARRLRPQLAGATLRRAAVEQLVGKRRPPGSATGCTSCARRRRGRGSAAARTSTRSPRIGSAPAEMDHHDAVEHTVRRYLGGFGPATLAEIANWAGVPPGDAGARAGAPAAAPLRLRGRRGAGRPAPRAAARPRHAGAGPAAGHVGRDPARPRAPRGDPPRAPPRARVPRAHAAVGADLPGRRRGGGRVALRRTAASPSTRSSASTARRCARCARRASGWRPSTPDRPRPRCAGAVRFTASVEGEGVAAVAARAAPRGRRRSRRRTSVLPCPGGWDRRCRPPGTPRAEGRSCPVLVGEDRRSAPLGRDTDVRSPPGRGLTARRRHGR